MAQREITVNTLFLACTRPAMWQGVPIEAACLNAMGTEFLFIIMKNPCYMLIGVVMHYVIRAFISKDYNIFGILRMWTDTKGRSRNTAVWGGSSVSPLPLGPARSAKEVRIHV